MNLKRRLLALLGLSSDAKVNVRTEDVDVTILGDSRHVQIVLESVRASLEEILNNKSGVRLNDATGGIGLNTESLVVRPTELDEKDSPYAIPEHRTVERIEAGPGLEHPDTDSDAKTHDNFTDTEPSAESITNPGVEIS
jgi:hypothetical protein